MILLYLLFNATTSILAIPAGRLSDRIGAGAGARPRLSDLRRGEMYLGFALLADRTSVALLFATLRRVQRADQRRGTGVHRGERPGRIEGHGAGAVRDAAGHRTVLLASTIAGLLYTVSSCDAPFSRFGRCAGHPLRGRGRPDPGAGRGSRIKGVRRTPKCGYDVGKQEFTEFPSPSWARIRLCIFTGVFVIIIRANYDPRHIQDWRILLWYSHLTGMSRYEELDLHIS